MKCCTIRLTSRQRNGPDISTDIRPHVVSLRLACLSLLLSLSSISSYIKSPLSYYLSSESLMLRPPSAPLFLNLSFIASRSSLTSSSCTWAMDN